VTFELPLIFRSKWTPNTAANACSSATCFIGSVAGDGLAADELDLDLSKRGLTRNTRNNIQLVLRSILSSACWTAGTSKAGPSTAYGTTRSLPDCALEIQPKT
jgi:hypothetical protein